MLYWKARPIGFATRSVTRLERRQPLATDEYGNPLSESDERAKLRPVVAGSVRSFSHFDVRLSSAGWAQAVVLVV